MEKRIKRSEPVEIVHPNAGGLDIGSREIWASVPAERTDESVQMFGTFTPDLQRLADWLVDCGVDTVAMESTGVYWLPAFEVLEARGLKVYLVNARFIKNVPGRKSDVQDCQWIQKLHTLGLLTGSFRPDGEVCALRAYLRHRAQLIQHRTPHILHMHKALQQMNVQLPQVLTDTTGETGMAILRAIVGGVFMSSEKGSSAVCVKMPGIGEILRLKRPSKYTYIFCNGQQKLVDNLPNTAYSV